MWYEERVNPGRPYLVMLHGWGMNSDVWGTFADMLAQHFSLFLIDLPGLGRSQERLVPYTSDAVVELLSGVVPERAHWLGWSMGGQIATVFAASYPERVTKLVTVASNPCFVQRDNWSCAMPEATHSAFETSLAENETKTLMRFAMLQTQGAEQGKLILKYLKALIAQTDHAYAYESLAPLREDVRNCLAMLSMPVLQLFGEKDLLVPVDVVEACRGLLESESHIYPDAGHLPFVSHQQQVVDDVRHFLES